MAKQTFYKTSFDLCEFDTANIAYLEKHTAMDATNVIHMALAFCQLSLEHSAAGRYTTAKSDRGCTSTLSHHDVAKAFNNRSPAAQPLTVSMYRSADALQQIHDIKGLIGAKTDGAAVGYALALSVEMVRKLEGANGGKPARIFFTATNHPYQTGYTFTKPHAFEVSAANARSRNMRVVKKALSTLNPWRAKPLPLTADPTNPAPTPAPAPEQDNTAEPQKPEIDTTAIESGSDTDIKAMKPVTFKNKGGFSL